MSDQSIGKPGTWKTCPVCDKDFRVKPSHYNKKTYCSRPCMISGYRERMKGENNPNYRSAGQKKCGFCGGNYLSYDKRAKFCSIACRGKSPSVRAAFSEAAKERWKRNPWPMARMKEAHARRVAAIPPKPPKPPRPSFKIEKPCVICGVVFLTYPYVKKCTCSAKCRKANISQRQKGERSHRWRGGLADEATRIRTSAAYGEWRDAVFTRDNYTCALCGKRGCRLAAHHIRLFSVHRELRLEVSNGITLCWPCHGEIKCKEGDYEERFAALVAAKVSK